MDLGWSCVEEKRVGVSEENVEESVQNGEVAMLCEALLAVSAVANLMGEKVEEYLYASMCHR
jgi:hypothetical protein